MDLWGYDDFSLMTQKLSVDDYKRFLLTLPKGTSIGFFGDSHLRTVVSPDLSVYAKYNVTPNIAYIPGATLLGFGRRNSSLGHFEKIKYYIETVRPKSVVLKFGQVDIDLGIYHKIVIKNKKIDLLDYIKNIIDIYFESLAYLLGTKNIYILPINHPTILDHDTCTEYTSRIITETISDQKSIEKYKHKLHSILPSYKHRSLITQQFNKYLMEKTNNVYTFIDTNEYFLKNNVLQEIFLNNTDHHYNVTSNDKMRTTNFILKQIFAA